MSRMKIGSVVGTAVLAALVGAATLPACGAAAQDWPQWRGPRRDGTAPGATLPEPWPKSLRCLWRADVGEGHSAPVVAGPHVVLLVRQGDDEVVLCLNASDGRQLWRRAYAVPYTPRADARSHGKGPKATPTISGGKVYTLGVTGIVSCLGLASGKLLWQKRFADRFKKTYPLYGAASSPLVEGKLCIVGIGGHDNGALAAYHKDTGQPAWELAKDGPGYASPVAVDLAGQRQIVTLMQNRAVGVEPATGRLLWHVPFTTPYDMNIITPVRYKDLIIWSGYNRGTTAVRIVQDEKGMAAKRVWHRRHFSMFMSSPVIHGDHLYGLSQQGGGRLKCLALPGGEERWSSPGRMGEYVSIILAGGKLLVLRTNGELLVVPADPTGYPDLARSRVATSPAWAHLALAAKRIYVKGRTQLACFGLSSQ